MRDLTQVFGYSYFSNKRLTMESFYMFIVEIYPCEAMNLHHTNCLWSYAVKI